MAVGRRIELPLAKRVHDALVEKREGAQASHLHPGWFAGKEICIFLTGSAEQINPGEIMNYAEFLHDTIIGTKKLFDELLEAGVAFAL